MSFHRATPPSSKVLSWASPTRCFGRRSVIDARAELAARKRSRADWRTEFVGASSGLAQLSRQAVARDLRRRGMARAIGGYGHEASRVGQDIRPTGVRVD